MEEFDIYDYAMKIFRSRENYHAKEAHNSKSHTVTQCNLSEAGAYNTAWWILYYAKLGNWEALEQFDYLGEEN